MATLEKIRNRAGVLVAVVIFIALLAFILGDLLNSGRTLFSSSQFEIAEISGKSVPYQTYQGEIERITEINKLLSGQSAIDEATMLRIRENTWQQMVRNYILEDEYDKLGVNVSSEELWDMIMGVNTHPIIQQFFADPETGQVNAANLLGFLKSYDQDPTGQRKTIWMFIEDQLEQDRLFSKYSTLITKGVYANSREALAEMKRSSRMVDFNFIVSPYNAVADSLVSVSSSEVSEYYDLHKSNYKQTPSRSIEYVSFEIAPSEYDRKAAEEWITNITEDFRNTESDQEFISLNSDITFDNTFYKKDELPENLQDLFNEKEGTLYGPYFNEDFFKLAKVSEVKNVPDSVKARHILLQPSQKYANADQLMALADSLKNLLKRGANFATLAKEFSTDKAANEKGGDLGWFRANMMVSPFSDTCFSSKTNEIKLVSTNYGLHLVEVTAKSPEIKKVKLAILGRKLEPSSETVQQTYSLASNFAGNNNTYDKFVKAIENQKLTKKVANNIQEADQQVAGLEASREFVRSIYQAENQEIIKTGDQAIFELGNRFVIGFVTEIREEGFASLNDVKSQIMLQVRKDKKAEILSKSIKEKMQAGSSLNSIANILNLPIAEATNINFRTYSVPNAGIEPKVVAVASQLDMNRVSEPIKGNLGVFVLEVKNVVDQTGTDPMFQKNLIISQLQSRSNYEAYEALREAASIVDKRSKFY